MAKKRVAILFGGRSGEHEISLISASSVVRNLDPSRFDVVLIGVGKDGRWTLENQANLDKNTQKLSITQAKEVLLAARPADGDAQLVAVDHRDLALSSFDVVFPVMHGPLCEDGTIQGLLELADVPYVGCGVLSSSVSMDKEVAKRLVSFVDVQSVPFFSIKRSQWERERKTCEGRVESELGYPVFVKPANMGSSVGIHKVRNAKALGEAVEDAFRYDLKILIEKGLNVREIELAVLEDRNPLNPPRVSIAGEIVPLKDFYSYEAKYLDENGAELLIPAPLEESQVREAQDIARKIFQALECEGLARVDLFLEKETGKFYFNEVNTMPGFTTISMFPKLWEATGIKYGELITELVDLAVLRHQRRSGLLRERGES